MEASNGFRLSQWKQCLAAFASTLMFFPLQVDVWSRLEPEGFLKFIYLVSGVVSVICGAIIAAVCSDCFGRKKTMLASSLFLPFGIAFIFSAHLSNVVQILSLIKMFFSLGFTRTAIALYISEITSINIRQTAMVLPLVTLPIFQLFGDLALRFLTDHFVSDAQDFMLVYQIKATVFAVIATLLFSIILLLCPETPYYLNWRKRCKETERSLSFYTGYKYVRTAELIPEPRGNSRLKAYAQEWKEKLRAITEMKNIRSLGIIFVLILIKWGFRQHLNLQAIYDMLRLYTNISSFDGLIVSFAIAIFTSFLVLPVILFARKIFLLAVIVISFIATLIGIWIKSVVILSVLNYVKFLGHFIFTGVAWSSLGILFPTNVKAIAIAIGVSLDMLIGSIMSLIEYFIYQNVNQHGAVYDFIHLPLKSYVDLGTLVVAFILVLIFIPKTIKVQPEGTFKNYAVVRS
ncbi:solute carrier family 22 member 4-like [Diprion similis]|uniref:solute carrier family 22 member 4-like n=1 Tax=Diprion similis TaxID=362088 RepID=UPI001EF8D501|nr:solute carrier family 22 member 4-like [Diprion similis]XP_046734469.1 solute carrier family 22 member 4-like [Diprion similis]